VFWKKKKEQKENLTSPAEETQIARQALNRGEEKHAVEHLAWALGVDPHYEDARQLLDQILVNHANPMSLTEWKTPPIPYQIVAIRAYICIKQGDYNQAISLMHQIYKAVLDLPFISWVAEWSRDKTQFEETSADTMNLFLLSVSKSITEDTALDEAQTLIELLPALRKYRDSHPASAKLTFALSTIYRKLGKLDEALYLAKLAHSIEPSFFAAVVLGNAYRLKGMTDETLTAFREALSYQPENIPIRLDIADVLCDQGQIEEGLRVYQEVLDLEPTHLWAYPSYLYVKSKLEPEGDWEGQLRKYAKANPENWRAEALVRKIRPYLTSLPESTEATINLAIGILKERAFPESLSISVTSLEAPSCILALKLLQIEQYGKADIKLDVSQIQKPDPRLPKGQVDFVLWKYKGIHPEPALPPPSSNVAEMVAKLAREPYDAMLWYQKATHYAKELSPAARQDLLAVMVHPPASVDDFPTWVWLQRIQYAAAFIIARLDEGWEDTIRRSTLLSLAHGPMDWSVEAAIVALCVILLNDKVGQQEVDNLYQKLLINLPRPGDVCYEKALLFCSFFINPSEKLATLARAAM
jgi:tetratricopeptide (TPR) repeat protein